MDSFYRIIKDNVVIKKDTKKLLKNYILLKQNMSADEKKMLLSIVDEKDLLIEDAAFDNYEKGFCEGIHFAAKIFLK